MDTCAASLKIQLIIQHIIQNKRFSKIQEVYKAINQHVSAATTLLGLEANQSDWTILSDADTWRGTWSIGTRYKANDIARYGGIVYKCITGHTSADNITLGLEEDQSKWEIQIEGIEYVTKTDSETGIIDGAWQNEYRYKKNDIVKRGGNLMKCIIGHTSTAGDAGFLTDYNASKWEIYLPGSEYENVWTETAYYQPGDTVLYGGYIYKAITFNTNLKPVNMVPDWNVTFEGYKFRNDWNNAGFRQFSNYRLQNKIFQTFRQLVYCDTRQYESQPDQAYLLGKGN